MRKAEPPKKILLENGTIITAPKDLQKGGTWIATDGNGRAGCLLNGAFIKHIRRPFYKSSRGNLVLSAFEASNFDNFLSEVELKDIEPFTLVLIEPKTIQKLVWDGSKKQIEKLPTQSVHLWTSATLYTSQERADKYNYLMTALKDKDLDDKDILKIHGQVSNTPFVLNRYKVKTVSIAQINYSHKNSKLAYIPINSTEL